MAKPRDFRVPPRPAPVLTPDALYLGRNGRLFCGRLAHAGQSALYTGRDTDGTRVHEVTDADRAAWRKELGEEIACEGCAAEPRQT